MDFHALLLQIAEYIGPLIVAALTVPVFGYLKKAVKILDNLPSPIQKGCVVIVSGVLAWIGQALAVHLPGDLSLFQTADVSALLGGAWAWAIHKWIKDKAAVTDGG